MQVVDASAVAGTLLGDGPRELIAATIDAWAQASACLPVHGAIEIASAIVKAERSERLSLHEANDALTRAASLIATARIDGGLDLDGACRLAREHRLSVQDACYLELAMRLNLPLLTGDKQLARACAAASVALPFDPNA